MDEKLENDHLAGHFSTIFSKMSPKTYTQTISDIIYIWRISISLFIGLGCLKNHWKFAENELFWRFPSMVKSNLFLNKSWIETKIIKLISILILLEVSFYWKVAKIPKNRINFEVLKWIWSESFRKSLHRLIHHLLRDKLRVAKII